MNKAIGPIILVGVLVIIGVAFVIKNVAGGNSAAHSGPVVTVNGLVGSEKSGFLLDPEVQSILRNKYGISVNFSPVGSIAIAKGADSGQDFLWPASQYARQMYENAHGPATDLPLFNSPIVLFAWKDIRDALVRQHIVEKTGEAYYATNMPKLVRYINDGRTWRSIGVRELTGPITVTTTDPTQSNSGFMFAGLIANILNGDRVVSSQVELSKVLPRVKSFYTSQGYQQPTTGQLFDLALADGEGSYPIWVGYESQYIEEAVGNPTIRDDFKDKVSIIYPSPTQWAEHIFMALDSNGVKLLHALQDPQIQSIAWSRHGLRYGLRNTAAVLKLAGVPDAIVQRSPLPNAVIMGKILQALHNAQFQTVH